jgi:hypothetical protein
MMKAVKMLAALGVVVVAGSNFAAAGETPQLLSIQYVTEGAITVALPTVKNADGSICKSYVADATRASKGKIDTTVKQICGEANASNSAPAALLSLQNVSTDGLTYQTPTVGDAQ